MKHPPLPPYELRTRPVPSTHYRATDIVLDGKVVYSVLGALDKDEADERVRAYLHPQKTQHVKEFYGAKPGPKPMRVKTPDDDLPPEIV